MTRRCPRKVGLSNSEKVPPDVLLAKQGLGVAGLTRHRQRLLKHLAREKKHVSLRNALSLECSLIQGPARLEEVAAPICWDGLSRVVDEAFRTCHLRGSRRKSATCTEIPVLRNVLRKVIESAPGVPGRICIGRAPGNSKAHTERREPRGAPCSLSLTGLVDGSNDVKRYRKGVFRKRLVVGDERAVGKEVEALKRNEKKGVA
jgi:hypothetical protein